MSSQPLCAERTLSQWLGFGPGFLDYETGLVKLLLEKTREEFGEAQYSYFSGEDHIKRVWIELAKGTHFQILVSMTILPESFEGRIGRYVLPSSRSLFGLRQSIILEKNRKTFESLRSVDRFKTLKPGQEKGWPDGRVYAHMGLPLIQAKRYDFLFPMLDHQRFDYLPLSILEIAEVIESKKTQFPSLAIARDIYIYYPTQINVYYSKSDPVLARRIQKGLDLIFSDGSEEALFLAKFSRQLNAINKDTAVIFMLQNPAFTPEQNRYFSDAFLRSHNLKNNAIPVERPK